MTAHCGPGIGASNNTSCVPRRFALAPGPAPAMHVATMYHQVVLPHLLGLTAL